MLTHIHPSRGRFTCRTRPVFNGAVDPAQSPGPAKARQMPRVPLPAPGVTSCDGASRASSEGSTPPSSLIRTHAPDQNPLAGFGCPYSNESSQVVVSPCWELALPDIISTIRAWALSPLPRSVSPVLLPVSSRKVSASPSGGGARHARRTLQCNFNRGMDFGAADIY